MELDVTKPVVVQRTREEILSLLEECWKNKMSVKEFALSKGVQEATVYYWKNKYGGKPRKQKPKEGFAALKITPSQDSHPATLFAEIGAIKIYHFVPASYLKELI